MPPEAENRIERTRLDSAEILHEIWAYELATRAVVTRRGQVREYVIHMFLPPFQANHVRGAGNKDGIAEAAVMAGEVKHSLSGEY